MQVTNKLGLIIIEVVDLIKMAVRILIFTGGRFFDQEEVLFVTIPLCFYTRNQGRQVQEESGLSPYQMHRNSISYLD